MPTTAKELWRDDWPDLPGSDGLMNAATGIALGIAAGLSAWAVIFGLVWMVVG